MAHDPALELDIAPEPEPDAAAALSRAVFNAPDDGPCAQASVYAYRIAFRH